MALCAYTFLPTEYELIPDAPTLTPVMLHNDRAVPGSSIGTIDPAYRSLCMNAYMDAYMNACMNACMLECMNERMDK